ncbi:MAG: hypothetical protein OCD76_05635 [Reichenbachiella sp.]
MSDHEFDVLDELYLLTSFIDLKDKVGMEDEEIKPVLTKLNNRGWLRCYEEPEQELGSQEIDLEINFRKYHYLASKAGLKAHTSIS